MDAPSLRILMVPSESNRGVFNKDLHLLILTDESRVGVFSTYHLTRDEAERDGLWPSCDYAILDFIEDGSNLGQALKALAENDDMRDQLDDLLTKVLKKGIELGRKYPKDDDFPRAPWRQILEKADD